MLLWVEYEFYKCCRSCNIGLLVVLLVFVVFVFGLLIVKIINGDMMEGFDYQFCVLVLLYDFNLFVKFVGFVVVLGMLGVVVLQESL